jgi:hypothetical protein
MRGMLRITVEEIPNGIGPARTLAVLGVANISDLGETSSYVYVVRDRFGCVASGVVRAHRRSTGFWPLLARVARAAAARPLRTLPRKWEDVAEAVTRLL